MAGVVFGPYRLLARLGQGGMGEVWRALDVRKDREVAVKVLRSDVSGEPGYAARFRREAALAARLNAPNIIPVHDYGEIDGRLFMEMPLIAGVDLDALIRRHGRLDPARAAGLIEQVADALDAAHAAGLVHRDVKPSNVLVTSRRGGREFAYLIDFGITRAGGGTRLTATGEMMGTLAYMAPERFEAGGDARADVYALACVLYQALTGQAPFVPPAHAHPLGFYLKAHLDQPPPKPSRSGPRIPAGLDGVVARGMAKQPADRYPSAGDLAAAAQTVLQRPLAPPAAAVPAPRRSRGTLVLRYSARSDRGLVRQTNQDSVYAGPRLLALADGMDDRPAGAVASSLVISALAPLDEDDPGDDLLLELREATVEGNAAIARHVADAPDLNGMGTSLTAFLFAGPRFGLVHVGNSRAYQLRGGELTRITRDDTVVQSLVDEGRITEAEARAHPRRSQLVRAVTGQDIDPSLTMRSVRPGDRFLLCSDGLSGVVSDEMLYETVATYRDPRDCAERMLELALRGGGPDNITCIVADVLEIDFGDDLPILGGSLGADARTSWP